MDRPHLAAEVIPAACKKHPMLFFGVSHLQQRIHHLVESVLAAYHEFRDRPFRMLGVLCQSHEESPERRRIRLRIPESLPLPVLVKLHIQDPVLCLYIPVTEFDAEEILRIEIA
ncbi:MAG: hypothetical protein PUA93_03850 [Eubacteriales bacterium]|nr:hypothetical protein [Eubacteriales bacterium]